MEKAGDLNIDAFSCTFPCTRANIHRKVASDLLREAVKSRRSELSVCCYRGFGDGRNVREEAADIFGDTEAIVHKHYAKSAGKLGSTIYHSIRKERRFHPGSSRPAADTADCARFNCAADRANAGLIWRHARFRSGAELGIRAERIEVVSKCARRTHNLQYLSVAPK
jgi:hypothetical protein